MAVKSTSECKYCGRKHSNNTTCDGCGAPVTSTPNSTPNTPQIAKSVPPTIEVY